MAKYNRPNGKLFGSAASNIGVFGSGQQNETPTTSTDPNAINTLGTHWEDGWNGAVVSQAPYTAPYVEDMNAVNYVNSYNSAYLLQRGIAEYSSNEEYQEDSVCTYNGEIWICLQDNTTGVTPTEGTYWHMQAEVPVMNDNAVLVGQTGVGATVTDTLNQGDIVASTTGLNIKSGAIVNADINASAAIAESKLNLAYTTSSLNTNITNVGNTLTGHTSNTSNPHTTTISNLNDTNISGSLAGDDTLVYDGVNSEWINTPNTVDNLKNVTITSASSGDTLSYNGSIWVNKEDSLSNLTDTTISTPSSGDALVYNGSKWANTENSIDNLTNVTITSENTGDTLVYDGAAWINQEDSLDNLTNTTITSASSGDALIYDGANWINQENSVANLSDTNVTTPSDGDVLVYDSLGTSWNNQANSLDNLTNTTITTPSLGDALIYDGSKWVNGAPAGGAVSTLSDVTLTTPLSDGEVLLYDSSSTKWVNSNIIEINDIANINTATTAITLTASDNRHQIFTATDGFDVTLPSTDIKAGETFIFDFHVSSFGAFPTTSMVFYVGASILCYAHTTYFRYIFTSLVDNPTATTDWFFRYEPQNQPKALSNEAFPYWCATHNKLWNTTGGAGTYTNTSSDLFTLPSGYYELTLRTSVVGGTWSGTGMDWFFGALDGDTGNFFVGFDSKGMAWSAVKGFQTTLGNTVKGINAVNTGSMNMTGTFKITKRQKNTKGFIQVVTAGNDYVDVRVNHYYKLIAPLTVDNVT